MLSGIVREFCAENFTDVPAAIAAGAARIELCDNLAVGGTTPSAGVIAAAVEHAHSRGARVMTMIRPRGGDFSYSKAELAIMERDLATACELGTDGVVFGCLACGDGGCDLDENALGCLMAAVHDAGRARGSRVDVTFHMAFDALDPKVQLRTIDRLASAGVTRILTHGGRAGTPIEDNLERLRELMDYAGDRIVVLPGGGITFENAEAVARALGAHELHGTKIIDLGR